MKQTIKADDVTVEGEYVIVKKIPYRATQFILWICLIILVPLCLYEEVDHFIWIIIAISIVMINISLASNVVTYVVPKKDLILIKRYINKHKVTVVFDDEKNKLEILK